MATQTKEQTLTSAQIKQVLSSGKEIQGVGKLRAMNLLINGDIRNSRSMLKEVIADRNSESRFRHMAVYGLYKKGGRTLNADLVEVAQHADGVTAATVASALGRTAPADQMALVEELGSIAADHLKQRAAFAATLLAYRHGLSSHTVRAPTARQMQQLNAGQTAEIKLRRATATQAKNALRGLEGNSLGVNLQTTNAQLIECEPNTFVWLWNSEAMDGALGRTGKGVAGVMLRKSRFDGEYALSSIGLTSPTRGGARLTIHRADSGKVMYAGAVSLDGVLNLSARDHPGLAAVSLQAAIVSGSVDVVSAKSARVAKAAKVPKSA